MLDAGLSVVPVTAKDFDSWTLESKGFSYLWKPYQAARMSAEQAAREFRTAPGIAVICGEISGANEFGGTVGLTVLDFDVETLYPTWAETCEAAGLNVHEFPTVQTRSRGFHVYVRSEGCEPNQKLCMVDRGGSGVTVGIETRGEGGLVFAPTTPGYEWIIGGFESIPTVPADDLALMLSIARAMDKTGPREPYKANKVYGEGVLGERPGDVFNRNADWRELLEADGARFLFQHGERCHYSRPGKSDRSTSSTTGNGHDGQDLLKIHSTNWPGLDAGCYSKFAYWTYTRHGGDFKKSTKAAAELYGVKRAVSVPSVPKPSEVESVGARLIGGAVKERAEVDADTLKQDLVLAEFIHEQRRGDFLWCEAWQSWVIWTGMRWERSPSPFGLIADIAKGLDAPEDQELRAILSTTRRINGAVPFLKTLPGVSVDPNEFDANPDILNTLSGIVCLRTGEIRPHSPSDRCTLLAPTEVAPEASQEGPFATFMEQVCLGREELANALITWLGYSITGRTTAQKWCVAVGGGRNGKTTLVEVMRILLGNYAGMLPTQLLLESRFDRPTFQLEALRGARFIAAEEPNGRRKLDREFIKQFTGGGTILVEAKHQKPYQMKITGKLLLATNHKPGIENGEFAFWRRCLMIPFDYRVPDDKIVDGLEESLVKEDGPNIMAWLVEGAKEFYKSGLIITDDMAKEIADYQLENDDLGRYLEECVRLDSPGCVCHPTALLTSYNAWSIANGLTTIDVKELKNRMKQKGFKTQEHGKKNAWVYVGLEIIEATQRDSYDLRQAGLED
jgi:P4 family phage/plasmid primase-like protien